MRRIVCAFAVAIAFCVMGAAPAWACGGLVNPNGTVSLVKTTTLAGYRYGVEHYLTSFKFQGGGAKFGSIVPLPGVPSKVRRGGDWTLQRLVREITPPPPPRPTPDGTFTTTATTTSAAQVLYQTEIDDVQITILRGGGIAVGKWAKKNGFTLTPDAPEVLDYYAKKSPIFMAASFDPQEAQGSGKQIGDGVPIHLNIRTDNPWVPLRILALGQADVAQVEADVFLLTKREPSLAPTPESALASRGLILKRSEQASPSLLTDLRSDKGMQWVHDSTMWLSYLKVDVDAKDLTYDLAADVKGMAMGIPPKEESPPREEAVVWSWGAASAIGLGTIAVTNVLFGNRS
ncbi:MAG TPA: DUF2330 domain-containing protein [Actinomycetota bacterium]|nr:DUF2330 domain-containing protein [Actinomycetota bacterium]